LKKSHKLSKKRCKRRWLRKPRRLLRD